MFGTEKILVSLLLEGKNLEVGEMVSARGGIWFRYHPEYLRSGFNLSPIKLPFSDEISSAGKEPFDGLYGVFNDSLPDGWGRLLLDRTLASRGRDIQGITPLDRLAIVGKTGMGALMYRPDLFQDRTSGPLDGLDSIAAEMTRVLQGSESDVIETLYALGGSSGGARPKIFVGYHPGTQDLIHGVPDLPEGYEDWIIKFQSSMDLGDIARIEYAYHKMALQAGIEMSECRLFEGKSGHVYFGTKRFDRIAGNRIHVHTASGLMHDNFRMSTMDYGHLMDCAFRLENHVKAYEKIFRLAAFNVFAHNRDDHSKNFSFVMDSQGRWRFAPAYDLTFSNSGYGFHSTMVAGNSQNPGRKDLMKLATHFGLPNAADIIGEVQDAVSQWTSIASGVGVGKATTKTIQKALNGLGD